MPVVHISNYISMTSRVTPKDRVLPRALEMSIIPHKELVNY
jgi:hypothetical protein